MSNVTNRQSRSQIGRASSRRTPGATPTTSPERRPLGERSQSQNNASPPRVRPERDGVEKIYGQTPFPKLPSQIFSPKVGPYIFEDKAMVAATSPTIPPKSPRRSVTPSGSTVTLGQFPGSDDAAAIPEIPPLTIRRTPEPRAPDESSKKQTFGDIFEAHSPDRRHRKQPSVLRKPVPFPEQRKPTTASSVEPIITRSKHASSRSGDQSGSRSPTHKSLEKVRSQSSVGIRATAKMNSRPHTPPSKQSRPRSASSPETPTEMFIQTLLQSGENVQYPTIRQPSVNSLRSYSSARAPYPAPLRLQRKRANSQLGRAASGKLPEGCTTGPQDQGMRQKRSKASVLSQSTGENSHGTVVREEPFFDLGRISGNWADEIGDVVPELEPNPLRRQRSDILGNATSDSRPTTHDSLTSGKGSFFHFLNDSKTAWANVYYQNESRIQLEAPPPVTQLQPHWTSFSEASTPRRSRSLSTGNSYSQSPASAGFPETIFIRRLRPHVVHQQPQHYRSVSSLTSLSTFRTIHHSASQSLENTATTTTATGNPYAPSLSDRDPSLTALPHPATPSHNATPPLAPIPRLSPDRRHGPKLSNWRAPSLDEDDSRSNLLFNPVNRQIFLFCLGFVFPFSWWLAAVLPLPVRPRMQPPEMRELGVNADARPADAVDLFDTEQVRRYQKARWWRSLNRGMSIVGLCVIAAIIACAVVASRR